MNKGTIAILMATYNGGKYLHKQIDSILAQTSQDWHLYIHDDGSKDDTLAVIHEYVEKHADRITQLNYPSQGGACRNFLSMLRTVEAPYYMFCDQDDVWHREKVAHSYRKIKDIEATHAGLPLMVHCNLQIVDEDLKVIHPSFWDICQLHPEIYHTLSHRVSSIIPGCTIIMNHQVKDIVGDASKAIMHDYWLTVRTLAAGGRVEPLDEALMDYRQHSDNAVGVESCYKNMSGLYKLTHLPYLLRAHKDNYRMLRAAGYGSAVTYVVNKVREFILVRVAEKKKKKKL